MKKINETTARKENLGLIPFLLDCVNFMKNRENFSLITKDFVSFMYAVISSFSLLVLSRFDTGGA